MNPSTTLGADQPFSTAMRPPVQADSTIARTNMTPNSARIWR